MRLVQACPLLRELALESFGVDDASEDMRHWLEHHGCVVSIITER